MVSQKLAKPMPMAVMIPTKTENAKDKVEIVFRSAINRAFSIVGAINVFVSRKNAVKKVTTVTRPFDANKNGNFSRPNTFIR